jgi:hypothetical protein
MLIIKESHIGARTLLYGGVRPQVRPQVRPRRLRHHGIGFEFLLLHLFCVTLYYLANR